MKNYEEKEKKLENVLKKLNAMSNKVVKMNKDIDLLNLEKNQLLREKEESKKNFENLSKQHEVLRSELENINKDVSHKFGNRNNLNQKIDELNQETETLINEIEKLRSTGHSNDADRADILRRQLDYQTRQFEHLSAFYLKSCGGDSDSK